MQSSHAKEAVNVYSGMVQAKPVVCSQRLALYVSLHANRGRKMEGQKLSTLQEKISKSL